MIMVFGASGQVARALRSLPEVQAFGRDRVDLMQSGFAGHAINFHRPRAVINAAAYTDVDGAETDQARALQLNAHAVGDMAQTCAALNIPLVHISSDYVFDGSGDAPWQPDARPAPINTYGHSKWQGELAVQAAGGVHVILRTSWVFSPTGKNFVTTMQRLGRSKDQISVVSDQIGGPTPASAIAVACLKIAGQLCQDPTKTGTYHFAGSPDVSWAGFAHAILQGSGCTVHGIKTAQYPTSAPRPLNSRLACDTLQRQFGVVRPDWRGEPTLYY